MTTKYEHKSIDCPLCKKSQRLDHLGRHLCRSEHIRQMTSSMNLDDFNNLVNHPFLFKNKNGRIEFAVCCCCEKAFIGDPEISIQGVRNAFSKFIREHKSRGCYDPEKVKVLREKQKKHLVKPTAIPVGDVKITEGIELNDAPVEPPANAGAGEAEEQDDDESDYDDLLARYEHNKAIAVERESELLAEIAALKKAGSAGAPKELIEAVNVMYDYSPDSDDDEEPDFYEKVASLLRTLKNARRVMGLRNTTIEDLKRDNQTMEEQIQDLEQQVIRLGGDPFHSHD